MSKHPEVGAAAAAAVDNHSPSLAVTSRGERRTNTSLSKRFSQHSKQRRAKQVTPPCTVGEPTKNGLVLRNLTRGLFASLGRTLPLPATTPGLHLIPRRFHGRSAQVGTVVTRSSLASGGRVSKGRIRIVPRDMAR